MKQWFLIVLMVLCLVPMTCCAEEDYQLWVGNPIDYENIPVLEGVETRDILSTVEHFGEADFLHGLAIERYHDKWYVTYAYNATKENVYGEQCFYQVSEDGVNWSEPKEIKPHMEAWSASHGVLAVADDTLYCMLPAVDFLVGPWGLVNELHRYDEKNDEWVYVKNVCTSFWPNNRPMQMDNGQWIVSGAGSGNTKVWLSEGDFLGSWYSSRVKREVIGSESSLIVQGNEVVVLMRPKAPTLGSEEGGGLERYVIGAAYSDDYGATFSRAAASDVWCSPSKIYAGVLSDGRPYMIWNQSVEYNDARNRLLLAVGEPGSVSFNRIYTLAEYNGAISYPYAIEHDGVLYVAHSRSIAQRSNGNQNDPVLTMVPVTNIP